MDLSQVRKSLRFAGCLVLVAALLGLPQVPAGADAERQTVSNVTIDDPTEVVRLPVTPAAFDMTFSTSAFHVYGKYRGIIWLQGSAGTIDLGVRMIPLPITGSDPAGPVTQTERLTVPDGTPFGLYTLCVRAEENWPPGSESWGFSRTDCKQDIIRIGATIQAVEFTQAIQELQTPDELASAGPKVDIVSGKPAAMRVYLDQVDAYGTVQVHATGTVSGTRTIGISPACSPEQRRLQTGGCLSADFYFTPFFLSGVNVTVRVTDLDGNESDSVSFEFPVRLTRVLRVTPVRVCDRFDTFLFIRIWECAGASELAGISDFTRKTHPGRVVIEGSGGTIRRATTDADWDDWWVAHILPGIRNLWVAAGSPASRFFHGMVRENAGGGMPGVIGGAYQPGNAGATRSRTVLAGLGDVAAQVVAHELGHNFGRRHIPDTSPFNRLNWPGCFGTPGNRDAGWPYGNDPRINEVGFDVSRRQAIDPETHYDWMSYCVPMWISPYTYQAVVDRFALASATALEENLVEGEFWMVSGTVTSDTEVELDPLFQIETTADADEGEGDYRIEVRDSEGEVLRVRNFEPDTLTMEEEESDPTFAELVLVPETAVTALSSTPAAIVVIGPGDVEMATVALEGETPTVEVTFPEGGETLEGPQELSWTVTDPDSDEHTFTLQYSRDGGGTWETLESGITETPWAVDFDQIAGSESEGSALIRILASDGVNTGVGVSAGFTVPSKSPDAVIINPEDGDVFADGDLVFLNGVAFDAEDGALANGALVWSSDRDGDLGTGQELSLTDLTEGAHTITLTATDSDGNSSAESVAIIVDATPPEVSLTLGVEGTSRDPGEILVLRTTSVSASIESSLLELDLEFTSLFTDDFAGTDFGPYDTIIVGMDGGTLDADDMAALRQAVEDGKRVIMFGGSPNATFAEAVNEELLPVDTTMFNWQEPEGPHWTVADSSHRLAWGLEETHTFSTLDGQTRNPSEYMLRVLETSAATLEGEVSVAVRNGDGYPAVFSMADGEFVAVVNTPWGAIWGDPADTALLNDLLANALELEAFVVGPVPVTIDAADEPGGSGLDTVSYSLDGGVTWQDVATDNLPFTFTIHEIGSVDLVVEARDRAGNSASASARFVIGALADLESLEVLPATLTLLRGGSEQLMASATYSSGLVADVAADAAWSSSDEDVVTVSPTGMVSGVGLGNATITASFGGLEASAALEVVIEVLRQAGANRYETAIEISKDSFGPGEAQAVVLARGDEFPDALAGTPLSVRERGPLLLTVPASLRSDVATEMQRVLPAGGTVYLLGGPAALDPAVESAVEALGYTVIRVAGLNRYATAAEIARRVVDGVADPTILIATGLNFPDALAAGAAAAVIEPAPGVVGGAVVLTAGSAMRSETQGFLDEHLSAPLFAIGGPAAAAAPDATPVFGVDRFATAVEVAQQFFAAGALHIGIATGMAFPDALAGGAHTGALGGPLLLARQDRLTDFTESELSSRAGVVGRVTLYGGPAALAPAVETRVRELLGIA